MSSGQLMTSCRSIDDCEVLVERPGLTILGAPLCAVFLMKLNRSSPQDLDDMRSMWPHVRRHFTSANDVVEQFLAAFPLEEPDEHLAQFVVDQLRRGGFDLPRR